MDVNETHNKSIHTEIILKYTALQKLRYNLIYCFLFFVHTSLINEVKNMKLSEHIFYEMINLIL